MHFSVLELKFEAWCFLQKSFQKSFQRSFQNLSGGRVRCFKCGKTGHRAWQCPEKAGVCFQCGKVGYVRKD